jgi:hypothetical protein
MKRRYRRLFDRLANFLAQIRSGSSLGLQKQSMVSDVSFQNLFITDYLFHDVPEVRDRLPVKIIMDDRCISPKPMLYFQAD